MMPLGDITLYFEGALSKLGAVDSILRYESNYIADFYHNCLNGYKPPKTGRITIMLDSSSHHPNYGQPTNFGSICSIRNKFDGERYSLLTQEERYACLLDTIHESCMICARKLKWDQSLFKKAYFTVISNQFRYCKLFTEKQNRARTHKAQIVLEKNEKTSFLFSSVVNLLNGEKSKSLLQQSNNLYWYDPAYRLAKSAKWFNNRNFGVSTKIADIYFSVSENCVIKKAKGNFN